MIRLSKPQTEIFQSQARFPVVVAGRRFGKTYVSIPKLLEKVWGRPNALACSPFSREKWQPA